MLNNLKQDLEKLKNPQKVEILQRFFKTGKGEYGEGDKFLGIVMPEQRKVAQKYVELGVSDIQKLLNSKMHEYRMTGLLILTYKYKKSEKELRRDPSSQSPRDKMGLIFNFYLKNTRNINNWDLVDVTAPNVVGEYLLNRDRSILYKLAKSENLWEKRIAMISTYTFIKNNDFKDTIKIAEILLGDKHDLMHKAVGWMLREVGNRDQRALIKFLDKYGARMARTTLRYAIEKFPEEMRQYYLKK